MRCWNARKEPRMGPKVHEVDTARSSKQGSSLLDVSLLRARAQTKVDEVRDPKGLFRILPSLRKNRIGLPKY